jgi:HEPN domain-containing protein
VNQQSSEIRQAINAELQRAYAWRQDGNEGRARVCARRAAGIAIGSYYRAQTGEPPSSSAYNLLRWLAKHTRISLQIRQAARRLTARVTADHNLPHPEDPLVDAGLIIEKILGETTS